MDIEKVPFLDGDKESTASKGVTTAPKNKNQRLWILVHIGLLVCYSSVFFLLWKGALSTEAKRIQVTSLHPINRLDVKIMPKPYDDFEQSPFAGLPKTSIDAAWHHLLEPTTIRVSAEELRKSNQSSVPLPNGGYMAWLGVFHELHCIKMVRQWVYRDYYLPNLTMGEVEEWSIHADHCLDIIRSAALCHGDTTLTTFGWANKSKPMLNTKPIDHRCVDWSSLTASVEDRVVGRDEMAALVNPHL